MNIIEKIKMTNLLDEEIKNNIKKIVEILCKNNIGFAYDRINGYEYDEEKKHIIVFFGFTDFFDKHDPHEIYFNRCFSIEFFEMDEYNFKRDNIVYNNSLYRLK